MDRQIEEANFVFMAQPPEEWVHRREYDEVLEALCPREGVKAGSAIGITTALR